MPLNDIRPGDVFLARSYKHWYSNAIAWFMRSEWSHCGLIRSVSSDGIIRFLTFETSDYEATYGSVEKYLEQSDFRRIKIMRVNDAFPDTYRQLIALRETDLKYYEKVYGYPQLISLGLRALLRRVGIRVPNFFRAGQVCTALPLHYLSLGKHSFFKGIDPEAYDTEEFSQMLKLCEAQTIFESGPNS